MRSVLIKTSLRILLHMKLFNEPKNASESGVSVFVVNRCDNEILYDKKMERKRYQGN
jgi:hypothetical protein